MGMTTTPRGPTRLHIVLIDAFGAESCQCISLFFVGQGFQMSLSASIPHRSGVPPLLLNIAEPVGGFLPAAYIRHPSLLR
jgi:hypothetical protein